MESLKRRTLRNPDASATRNIGRSVSLMSCFANCSLLVLATATGEAPRWTRKSRFKCRALTPRRSDRSTTLSESSTPSVMRRSARLTVVEVPFHAGVPGAVSGRQRRHGRKPAATASSADWK